MVLTEAFAAGTPVIASAIAGYSDVVTDGLDGVLVPPADPQRLAEELQRAYHEPERLRRDGRARPGAAPSATPGRMWPTGSPRSTSARSRRLSPSRAGERFAAWAGYRPRRRRPARPAQRLPSLDPALARERQAQAPDRAPRRARRRRRPRRRPDRARGAARSASTTSSTASSAPTSTWVLIAFAPDVPLPLLSRRLLVLDRHGGAAQPPCPPPRRHLGDDDRRPDVGDPAGPPRRAGAGALALAQDRPHARTFPVLARHAGLADPAQHPRPRPARRDHRLDHRPLPLEHPEDLRLQLRAAGRCCSSCSSPRC